jgi:hypothetical protein
MNAQELTPPLDNWRYENDPGPEALDIRAVSGTLSDSEKAVIRWLIANPPSKKRPGHGIANKTHGITINDALNEATFEERLGENRMIFLPVRSVRFTILRQQPAQLARKKPPTPETQPELFPA